MNDELFSNAIPDSVRFAIIQSGALPTVTGIHHITERELVVNDYFTNQNDPKVKHLVMGLQNGINVICITFMQDGSVKVVKFDNPQIPHLSVTTELVATKNSRYLMQALSNPSKDANRTLKDAVKYAKSRMNARLETIAYNFSKDKPHEDLPPTPPNVVEWLMQSFYGSVQKVTTPDHILHKIESVKKFCADRDTKMTAFIARCEQMFNRPKWIIFYRFNKGMSGLTDVSVGVLDGQKICHSIKRHSSRSISLSDNDLFIEPMKLSKGFENIDPNIRDAVMGKLTMMKMLRDKLYNNPACIDTDRYVASANYTEVTQMNSMTLTDTVTSIILLDR